MLGFNSGWSRHWYASDRTRPLRLLLGAGVDAGVNLHMKEDNTNNSMAYFFHLSLNPDIMVKYRWFNSQKTKFELAQQIYFPIGSLISSSEYSSTLPMGIAEKDASFFDAMRLVSLGSFKRCATITTLDVAPALNRRQKLPVFRISYIFSGMNYNNGDFAIKAADHLILFGAIFH